jgi:hypothetical protein
MVVEKASGRVPGRAHGSSRSRDNDCSDLQYVSRKSDPSLGFSRRGELIGERATSEGGPVGLTPWWRGLGVGRTTLGCGWLLPPSVSSSVFTKLR